MAEEWDRERLEAWLYGKSREVTIAIAARAAIRTLPLLETAFRFEPLEEWQMLQTFAAFRCSLISAVAAVGPTADLAAAAEAAEAAASFATGSAEAAAPHAVDAACTAVADAAADAAEATYTAAAADADAAAANAASAAARDADAADVWAAIGADVERIGAGMAVRALFLEPLWPGGRRPDWTSEAETRLFGWLNDPEWAFWRRWYRSMRDGQPMDWDMQREIALIPDEDWKKGPEHIAGLIAEIEARYLTDSTPLAEQVVWTAEDRLAVEPIPLGDAALYDTVLMKVWDALADIGWPDGLAQHHEGLRDTLKRIDRALARYGDNPQRVHDDFVLSAASIGRLMKSGEIAEDETVLALRQVLDTGALDVRRSIPEVDQAFRGRAIQRLAELSPEQADRIEAAGEAIAEVASEEFAGDVRADIAAALGREDANDPNVLRANPEERLDAAWRTRRRVPLSYTRIRERMIDGTTRATKGLTVGSSLGTLATKIKPAIDVLWDLLSGL